MRALREHWLDGDIVSVEITCLATSLTAADAVLELKPDQGAIENRLHWVR